jgi:putative CRISPR-associated protein (TIGR02619 family)
MRTVICTVGTSIAQGTDALRITQQQDTAWDDAVPDLVTQIVNRLTKLDLSSELGRVRASAEIHSLHRLKLDESDQAILLATDTADGRACAQAVKGVLLSHFGLLDEQVKVVRVLGLQVRDADKLRRVGLPALVEETLRLIEDPQLRYAGEIILNPTGGFKGVVPFLTVLGMLFGLRTIYVFEFANSLISLPPLPVSFDLRLYERALPALELVLEQGIVSEGAFFSAIEGFADSEHDLFTGFIERDGGVVTLSTLAQVLVRMDSSNKRGIKLLPEVRRKWESAIPGYKAEMERILIRAASPLWRKLHGHSFKTSELFIFGEVSGARIAGIVTDDVFHVTSFHLIDRGEHAAYEAAVTAKKPSDFNLDGFIEWQATDDLKSVNERLLSAERSRLLELEAQVSELKSQLSALERPLRQQVNELRSEAARAKRVPRLEQQIAELTSEAAALRREILTLKKTGELTIEGDESSDHSDAAQQVDSSP